MNRFCSRHIMGLAVWWVIVPCVEAAPGEVVAAARAQVGVTVSYDPSYQSLTYPGGDVPRETGVCTDVVIRALREALGMDLQKLVHEDMRTAFAKYPQSWGLTRPDRNIDHRRVPNLRVFFQRQGWELPLSSEPGNFHPGDLVTCTVPRNLPHIMIVSDKTNAAGVPLVVHNIGRGAREEDRLLEFPLTGHYRIPPLESSANEADGAEVIARTEERNAPVSAEP
jgi:uncharacterized protein YijF (DUF1287 family)